jgi:hypothetical protein
LVIQGNFILFMIFENWGYMEYRVEDIGNIND